MATVRGMETPVVGMTGHSAPTDSRWRWRDRVDFPSIRDPRLHVAGVILTIHVLGQYGLGFAVSIPQILSAILACALIEIAVTARQTGRLVWPASAILTGSGVALIFRLLDTEPGDHWSFGGWYLFALVGAVSLGSKYLIRYKGSHVFNPSNAGLVAAFLVLGSDLVEPLDFWWGHRSPTLILAYITIIGGGVWVTRRLGLLAMASAFWLTFVVGIGWLTLTGHCITARWAFGPVCGGRFFSVVATSPEVLVFLFFMITDPRTIPVRKKARLVFAFAVAIVSVFLVAPQTTEFAAKVGLLGALVIMTGVRPLFEIVRSRTTALAGRVGALLRATTGEWMKSAKPRLGFPLVAVTTGTTLILAIGILWAGAPARPPVVAKTPTNLVLALEIDPEAVPEATVDQEITRLDSDLTDVEVRELALALATCLAGEAEAFAKHDPALLAAASVGPRLNEMELRLERAMSSGSLDVVNYRFDTLHLVVTHPYGPQGGASRGFEGKGTAEAVTLDLKGELLSRRESPFALTFSVEEVRGGEWRILNVVPTA